ncbi:hypothetical protein [Halarchaeum sp. P4]|uniref:hypothetical protein n=1 Tax=Halarchaeum sp. P4 TaxID=3421639 RepID=UPI003EBFEE02
MSSSGSGTWQFETKDATGSWTSAEAPMGKTLNGVTGTVRGPVAVGKSGYVIARSMDDGNWGVLYESGPAAENNVLSTVASTDDGKRVWFAGQGGALGCYDIPDDRKYDFSDPNGKTRSWESIAVAGDRGNEKLLLGSGSGEVLPAYMDGTVASWDVLTNPGGSTTIVAADATPDGVGYVADSTGGVYKTTVHEGWSRIGIEPAGSVHGLTATSDGVLVVSSAGRAFDYAPDAERWTPYDVGSKTLYSVAHTDGTAALAVGSSGSLYRHANSGWIRADTPTGNTLNDVTLGPVDVAVGSSGTIIERNNDVS